MELPQFVLGSIGNSFTPQYVTGVFALNKLKFTHITCGGWDPVGQLFNVVETGMKWGLHQSTAGILWVEHDHGFGVVDVATLLGASILHPEAVIAGIYMQRMRTEPVATEPLECIDKERRIFKAELVSLGFTWTPWSVFEKTERPWFDTRWAIREDNGEWHRILPDQWLSMKCQEAGIELLCMELPSLIHAYEPGPRGLTPEWRRALAEKAL
jgi:hypothetical protein